MVNAVVVGKEQAGWITFYDTWDAQFNKSADRAMDKDE